MLRLGLMLVVSMAAFSGCGEDKNYGDPIEDPAAAQAATAAIINAQTLPAMASNDTPLNAVNGISGAFNLLGGVKLQHERGGQDNFALRSDRLAVDEACVNQSSDSIEYIDCAYVDARVNGTVRFDGSATSFDLRFNFDDEEDDFSQETTVKGELDVSDVAITGNLDVDLDITTEGMTFGADFDGDFAVDIADGCAVGGNLEVHAVARAGGRSESVWALAEYGPTCEDVVVR